MPPPSTFPTTSFHPLKSGRNLGANGNGAALGGFPSPQVGSELKAEGLLRLGDLRFHPLKSGRNLDLSERCGKSLRQFPSPQVRSELASQHTSQPNARGFHPLKSGRNTKILSDKTQEKGFPSPQVGSEPTIPCAVWEQTGFHPLKSGRNYRRGVENHYAMSSFHPLKSGRNVSLLNNPLRYHLCFHPLKSGRNQK